ncbi:putative transmembrane Protein [Cryptosporidium felis]|nr:putative transmembrane Protein [Cryptosporidium felis]
MGLFASIQDFVLPGTFGTGRRAKLTGIVATVYQVSIYGFVLASIFNSFMLYIRFGRINSFVTIYSELNGIESPSLIYCNDRKRFGNDLSKFNGMILIRILHYNRYYYSNGRNIRMCTYEGAPCLCIDSWRQTYYTPKNPEYVNASVSWKNASPGSSNENSESTIKSDLDLLSIFRPGEFPVPLFIKNEIDYQISTKLIDNDVKYKPHFVNWCGLNIGENDAETGKKYPNVEVSANRNNSNLKSKYRSRSNVLCENKDMVELLFISENEVEGGIVGFYTSMNHLNSEPMWVKTSFPGIISAFLQLEKNWIIDFYLLKYFIYHRFNPFYYVYKYFFGSNSTWSSDSAFNYSTYDDLSQDDPDLELRINDFQSKSKAYLVSESQKIVADIAQIHGKVLPKDLDEWLKISQLVSNSSQPVKEKDGSELESENPEMFGDPDVQGLDSKFHNITEFSELVNSNYSTLWVRAEYQIFVTPNTVRVANKHFLLQTFGLIMSIIFSLNYLNIFYSVFPFYRGSVPKLTVSPLTKFLSCNLLNSYHD